MPWDIFVPPKQPVEPIPEILAEDKPKRGRKKKPGKEE